MEIIKLKTRYRNGKGKSYTRKIRQQNWIPAVYYGHDRETKLIEIDAKEFSSIVRAKKTTHIINLDLPDESGESNCIIKEIQNKVLNQKEFYHVDFQHIEMNETVTVECPIKIVGVPIGVKEDKGVLNHPVRSVQIECLPQNIPEAVTVDVSELRMGQSIHIKDISLPDIVIKESPDEVIAVVVHPQSSTSESLESSVEAAPLGDVNAKEGTS